MFPYSTEYQLVAEYQLLSDEEGKSWARSVLDAAVSAKKILNYSVIESIPGTFGLQLVIFTVTTLLTVSQESDKESIKNDALKLLNEIVGDTDVDLRWICPLETVT